MNSRRDRIGWLTGALVEAPACPPFPAFTDFEQKVLDCIAPMFGDSEASFRAQVASAQVIDRINTIVGFYTRVQVDRSKCAPVAMSRNGGHFDVKGIENGMGVILWDENGDGYLETIEGYTYDDDALAGKALPDLQFIRLVQLG
jgi:hypothetical protein